MDQIADYEVATPAPHDEQPLPTPDPQTVNPFHQNLPPSSPDDESTAIPQDFVPSEEPFDSRGPRPSVDEEPIEPAAIPDARSSRQWQPQSQPHRQTSYSPWLQSRTAQPAQYSEHSQATLEERTGAALQRFMADEADPAAALLD